MDKDGIKKQVLHNLHDRPIVVFGAGEVAEEFCIKYSGTIKIAFCVSNVSKEWGEKRLNGEIDVCQYSRSIIPNSAYIVVCSKYAFQTIEQQLVEDGYKPYKDFMESHIIEAILKEKPMILFYGTCVLRDVYECLKTIPSFDNAFSSVYTQASFREIAKTNRVLYYAKSICDYYIYTSKVLDRDTIYSLSKDDLPDDCRIISVSNLTFSAYWPQINSELDSHNPMYLHPYHAKRSLDFYHTLYRKEDKNITEMVCKGISVQEIIKTLSNDSFYTEKEVRRNEKIALKTIQIAERALDVTIYDFILDKYIQEPLYQNYIHPNKYVVWEYVRRILNVLGVCEKNIQRIESEAPEHVHEGGDVPVYPSVANIMNLAWAVGKKYGIMTGHGIVEMSFEEYVEHFAEYTYMVKNIKELW